MRNVSALNPVLARRVASTEAVRHRMSYLFATADADGPGVPGVPVTPATSVSLVPEPSAGSRGSPAAESPPESPPESPSGPTTVQADPPDDWPRGYGRRRVRHRSAAQSADPPPKSPPSAVPSAGRPAPAPDPDDPPDRSPKAPAPPSGARRRLRAPTAWYSPHAAIRVDRRAVAGLSVLLLLAVAYAVQHFWLGRPRSVAVPIAATVATASTSLDGPGPAAARARADPPPAAGDTAPTDAAAASAVVVDVAGKVTHPGVHTLPGGSRVADAIRAAGGAQPGVDTDGLNLARVLVDGEQVLVGSPSPPGGDSPSGPRPPVSLNHASLEQLDALPGVGPVLARHILDFRTSHAGFRSLDQLRQISGIGDRKLAELKQLVTL